MLDAASFGRVFKKARRSSDRLFTVLYRNNGGNQPRLGLAISKKNCRLAVQRNRLKRLVRESFRQHFQELAGMDIVVLNRRDSHKADNKALFESLAKHWHHCQRKGGDDPLRDRG
jgi:ribonuclease P protein component